jgi:hypothetical protein
MQQIYEISVKWYYREPTVDTPQSPQQLELLAIKTLRKNDFS